MLLLSISLAASACGADINSLENFCFALRNFDFEKAAGFVDDAEGYFAKTMTLAKGLDTEKAVIAKDIFSNMSFSDFKENDGAYTLTVKYVDFKKLILAVESHINTGASASDVLREMTESGRIGKQFTVKQSGVPVMLTKNGKTALVPLGRAGVNAEFTAMLGIDTFLEWYILQM